MHFAKENNIEITVVGPEKYLVDGIVDDFKKNGLKIIGPTKEAAKLEGSKSEAKLFMTRNNIETAQYELFNESEKAISYAKNCRFPLVIKADGLASGKGVFIVGDWTLSSLVMRLFRGQVLKRKTSERTGGDVSVAQYKS